MAGVLEAAKVDDWVGSHPQWKRDGESIVRSIEAPSFLDGIDLVQGVARLAEDRNHHPDIDVRWRTVTLRLSTHSAGGITAADLDLAEAIDKLV